MATVTLLRARWQRAQRVLVGVAAAAVVAVVGLAALKASNGTDSKSSSSATEPTSAADAPADGAAESSQRPALAPAATAGADTSSEKMAIMGPVVDSPDDLARYAADFGAADTAIAAAPGAVATRLPRRRSPAPATPPADMPDIDRHAARAHHRAGRSGVCGARHVDRCRSCRRRHRLPDVVQHRALGRPPAGTPPIHSRLDPMPGNPFTDPNWAKEITDTIDRFVGKVRTTVTDRIVFVVRAVVFGIVIAIAAPVTFILLVILSTKLLQRVIALAADHDSSIWISYAVMGGLLVLFGSLMMRKRFAGEQA